VTDVACIGECMIELREQSDGLLSRGFGGDTLNTAVYLARLGVGVDYVSALGTDPFSDEMLEAWRDEGVGTENVLRVSGRLPGLYLVQTDGSGERRFSYWRESAPVRELIVLPGFSRIAEALQNYRVIYLSGITLSLFDEFGRNSLFELLDEARSKGSRIAFDTNYRSSGWVDRAVARSAYERIIERSDLVLATLEDYGLLADQAGASKTDLVAGARLWLEEAMKRELVLRSGDLDCWIFEAGREVRVPAKPAACVVDTTAAGDSFAAAYIAARLQGASPNRAASNGHRLAAIVIAHSGAIAPRAATQALAFLNPSSGRGVVPSV
jgi:2-dehydro-3-deoxygluconokinase